MKSFKTLVIVGTLLASLASMAPSVVLADQNSKNTWRNIGIGSAAVGAYGALHGDRTTAVVGLAGAGYSAYRYEQDRKHQSQAASWRRRHYHHHHHYYH